MSDQKSRSGHSRPGSELAGGKGWRACPSPHHFPNPWISSLSAAVSTGIGAFIPIIPFFFLAGFTAVVIAFAVSMLAHFAVGAAKFLITTRSWWASGIEMTLAGIREAAVAYTLGLAVGRIG